MGSLTLATPWRLLSENLVTADLTVRRYVALAPGASLGGRVCTAIHCVRDRGIASSSVSRVKPQGRVDIGRHRKGCFVASRAASLIY